MFPGSNLNFNRSNKSPNHESFSQYQYIDDRSDAQFVDTLDDEDEAVTNALDPLIHFKFGTRNIEATGHQSDHAHPNVLLLEIRSTLIERIIHAVAGVLPEAIASRIQTSFPEWFLPRDIVLKRQKKGWEEEFDCEVATYGKLQQVQGLVIPRLLGQVKHRGARALILSNIGGHCVATAEGAVLEPEDMRRLFYEAFVTITDLRVAHGDPKLDNFHLVTEDGRDKIMIVDLERVDEDMTVEQFAEAARIDTDEMISRYRRHLKCLEYDELILPKRPLKN